MIYVRNIGIISLRLKFYTVYIFTAQGDTLSFLCLHYEHYTPRLRHSKCDDEYRRASSNWKEEETLFMVEMVGVHYASIKGKFSSTLTYKWGSVMPLSPNQSRIALLHDPTGISSPARRHSACLRRFFEAGKPLVGGDGLIDIRPSCRLKCNFGPLSSVPGRLNVTAS